MVNVTIYNNSFDIIKDTESFTDEDYQFLLSDIEEAKAEYTDLSKQIQALQRALAHERGENHRFRENATTLLQLVLQLLLRQQRPRLPLPEEQW